MIRLLLLTALFLLGSPLIIIRAQTGEIQGVVSDAKTGEPIAFANVTTNVGGTLIGAKTDFSGAYSVKPLPPGEYTVTASYVGYTAKQVDNVRVTADKVTSLDIQLGASDNVLQTVEVVSYKVPLLEKDQTSTGGTVTKEEIDKMARKDVNSLASTTAGVYQNKDGGLNIKGARAESSDYYIDGIKVRGSLALPSNAIEQLTVITGGLPAKYGDATGGITAITTRGPSQKFGAGFQFETSGVKPVALEPYGFHQLNFNLTGPILKKKISETTERSVIGYFIAGEITHQDDPSPSAVQIYKVKDDIHKRLVDNPLVFTDQGGFLKAIDYMSLDSLEAQSVRPDAATNLITATGKIDIQPVPSVNLSLGSSFTNDSGNAYVRRFELFNSDHNGDYNSRSFRAFARLTQRFGANKSVNANAEDAKPQSSYLQNAFYSLQFDFNRTNYLDKDPVYGDNLFNYGYIGKFDVFSAPLYNNVFMEDVAGTPFNLRGWTLQGMQDTALVFTPSDNNPGFANRTQQLIDYVKSYGGKITTLDNLTGFLNGAPSSSYQAVYSLWYVPGTAYSVWSKNETSQYRLVFNGSFDLKRPEASELNKHAIEFGFEYEQRDDRSYTVSPLSLWNLMDGLQDVSNSKIERDLLNPILVIDGQEIPFSQYDGNTMIFSENDTIKYNFVRTGEQGFFDKTFRKKFGLSPIDIMNVHAISPDQYSLDMFSPDELLNDGGAIVSGYGYDYLGNKLSKQPAFNDFFTAKDETTGEYTRLLGSFRPIYVAGYIQDKFQLKDLIFNLGVRVDRFDANLKVPKDIYTPLYAAHNAGDSEVKSKFNIPSTIGSDYTVYVDNEVNPSTIKGFRRGDDWYDANGLYVRDPQVLATGGEILPWLVNPLDDNPGNDVSDKNYNPDLAFEDYKPEVTVQPRIAFSFEISDEAIFFAHYDVLAQRPQGRLLTLPDDWYYMPGKSVATYNNPNLRAEKTIDYQIGFKQKLNDKSALTLSGFYREGRDMVQISNVTFSYPITYSTFRNLDFSTAKGFELTYDLRRTENVRLLASYTMSFAEGTGSGDASQANLISFGVPNLRNIIPLSYDSRHMINLSFDYRFATDASKYNGPRIKGRNILAGLGLNVTARGRSGAPYTRQANPTPTAQFGVVTRADLDGTINGSRLPWNFQVDARLDKDFLLNPNKKEGKKPLILNVYLTILNALDADNVSGVYAFTGSAENDGYLNSPEAATFINQLASERAFRDLYGIYNNTPGNYAAPRRLRLGMAINF